MSVVFTVERVSAKSIMFDVAKHPSSKQQHSRKGDRNFCTGTLTLIMELEFYLVLIVSVVGPPWCNQKVIPGVTRRGYCPCDIVIIVPPSCCVGV